MDLDTVADLVSKHLWLPLLALVIGSIVRLVKSDAPLPISPRLRPWVALLLGVFFGVLDAIAQHRPLGEAVSGGLLSALGAMAGHDLVIESLRDGKELFAKK